LIITNVDYFTVASATKNKKTFYNNGTSSNPRYFFDIVMEGRRMGRVIIEVEASLAPKMAINFHTLVTGERGFGYRGCQFFQVRYDCRSNLLVDMGRNSRKESASLRCYVLVTAVFISVSTIGC
jgi:hypothetical protein